MTASTASATEILADLSALVDMLADRSSAKHTDAIAAGLSTPEGRALDGQSHAYVVAALRARDLLTKYSA